MQKMALFPRVASGLVMLLASAACAQTTAKPNAASPENAPASTLPAMLVTQLPPPLPQTPAPQTPAEPPPKPAEVAFSSGMLTVKADNSSLSQILGEIARQTGMKITGGVADDRVYGSYGPAICDAVLSQLLDGTGTNVLIVHGSDGLPTELALTARNGGPTPPSPHPANEGRDNYDRRQRQNLPQNNLPPQQIPTQQQPTQSPQQPGQTPQQRMRQQGVPIQQPR